MGTSCSLFSKIVPTLGRKKFLDVTTQVEVRMIEERIPCDRWCSHLVAVNKTGTAFSGSQLVLPLIKDRTNHLQLLPNESVPAQNNNIAVVQRVLKTPFQWTVTLQNVNSPASDLSGGFEALMSQCGGCLFVYSPSCLLIRYERYSSSFDEKFSSIFSPTAFLKAPSTAASGHAPAERGAVLVQDSGTKLAPKGSCGVISYMHTDETLDTAEFEELGRALLSHLLVGYSFFAGDRYAQDPVSGQVYLLPNASIFSMIPSKFGFPRPFFWDEAFHQKVVSRWDADLFEKV